MSWCMIQNRKLHQLSEEEATCPLARRAQLNSSGVSAWAAAKAHGDISQYWLLCYPSPGSYSSWFTPAWSSVGATALHRGPGARDTSGSPQRAPAHPHPRSPLQQASGWVCLTAAAQGATPAHPPHVQLEAGLASKTKAGASGETPHPKGILACPHCAYLLATRWCFFYFPSAQGRGPGKIHNCSRAHKVPVSVFVLENQTTRK